MTVKIAMYECLDHNTQNTDEDNLKRLFNAGGPVFEEIDDIIQKNVGHVEFNDFLTFDTDKIEPIIKNLQDLSSQYAEIGDTSDDFNEVSQSINTINVITEVQRQLRLIENNDNKAIVYSPELLDW